MRALRLLAVMLLSTSLFGSISEACDKKGHDCRGRAGRKALRDLPLRVAQTKAFLANERVHADILYDGDDTTRLAEVIDGSALFAIASPAEIGALVTKDRRIKIIAVLQSRPTDFLAAGTAGQLQELRGAEIGVASLTTEQAGYTTIALARAGLTSKQYSFRPVSAPNERLAALLSKQIPAAILPPGLAFEAQRRGTPTTPLAVHVPDAAAAILIGRDDILEGERTGVIGLLRALRASIAWLHTPGNRAEIVEQLRTTYDYSQEASAFVYESLIGKKLIYATALTLNEAMIKTTNQALVGTGVVLQPTYIEERYVREASGSR